MAIRQRGFLDRTCTRIIREEDSDATWSAVRDHVSRDAKVYADEHGSYNDIIGLNRMGRMNHSKASSSDDGTNTNFIESFFSRIQRAYVGVHHRFSTRYLDWYVADLTWKEDARRLVTFRNGCLASIS